MWTLFNLLLTLGKGCIVKQGILDKKLSVYLEVYGVLLTDKFKNKVLCYEKNSAEVALNTIIITPPTFF
jgi:hypothetical protein